MLIDKNNLQDVLKIFHLIYESYIDECDSDNYSDFFDNYVSPVNDFLKNTAISEASLHIDEFVGFVNLFIYKLMIDY